MDNGRINDVGLGLQSGNETLVSENIQAAHDASSGLRHEQQSIVAKDIPAAPGGAHAVSNVEFDGIGVERRYVDPYGNAGCQRSQDIAFECFSQIGEPDENKRQPGF